MSKKTMLPLQASTHYPDKKDIDRHWIPVEDFLLQRGLLNLVFEEDLFLAVDTALRDIAINENITVLAQNSAKRLCINPLLLPGIERFFAHYLPQDWRNTHEEDQKRREKAIPMAKTGS